MTPIEKNVAVIGESGEALESTYLKRARGLIKNGRARRIDDNTIQMLARPPIITEDANMEYQPKSKDEEANAVTENTITETTDGKLTAEQILGRIDKIMNDTAYIREAFEVIKNLGVSGVHDSRGNAVGEIVTAREKTNQQTLRLLEKMYDDIVYPRAARTPEDEKFRILFDEIKGYPPNTASDIIRKVIAPRMFVKEDKEADAD